MHKSLPLLLSLLLASSLLAQTAQRSQYCDLPVYFEFGADSLTTAAQIRLSQLAEDIRELPGLDIRLTAHTDDIGSNAANLKLSARRAKAIARLLFSAGIPDSCIQEVSQGEGAPIADNDTPEGRQQNRRVEVLVHSALSMRKLEGQITNKENAQGVPAWVFLSTPTWADSVRTDSAGRFAVNIPALQRVRLDAFATGYFFDTAIIPKDSVAKAVATALALPPAKKGLKLPVKRLHFLSGKAVLKLKSIPELSRLARFLQINPDVEIIIHGHVNVPNAPPLPEASFHYKLSERRALHVMDFLIGNRIAPERLSWEAHCNWEMLYPKTVSEGQQAANRRVEIEVK